MESRYRLKQTPFFKAGANASNIENFACWMKCWMHLRGVKFYEKWKKKKKIVLDDVG